MLFEFKNIAAGTRRVEIVPKPGTVINVLHPEANPTLEVTETGVIQFCLGQGDIDHPLMYIPLIRKPE